MAAKAILRSTFLVVLLSTLPALASTARADAASLRASPSRTLDALSHWIRFHAEMLKDGSHNEIQAGIGIIPFDLRFAPRLTIEAGHFYPSDTSGVALRIRDGWAFTNPLLRYFRHYFVKAHLGLEIHLKNLSLFVLGGLTRIETRISGVGTIRDLGRVSEVKALRIVPSAGFGLTAQL